jgi:hypothetical protein
MARQHGVTSNTYKKFVIDSGAVYINYGESGQALLGATRGGNTFTIETEYREMPADGAKGPVKGSRRITRVDASLTVNLLEMSATNIERILTGSAVADYPVAPGVKTHDSITRTLQVADADYFTNIALVGEVTGNSTYPAVFLLKNAISDGNFEIALTDAEEGVLAITFKAHFLPSTMDSEPWEIRFPTIS